MKESVMLIYVAVRGDPVDVWAPVKAVHEHGDCYRVMGSSPDPGHDHWQFSSGDIVRCESYTSYEGEAGLVARSGCECEA
jgi:hypothetical protein